MKRVIFVLLLAPLLSGQSVEERLSKLEQEVRELRAENEELRRQIGGATTAPPPAAAPQPVAQEIRPAGRESALLIGGFVQAQAESGDRVDSRYGDDNDRAYLRRARLNLQGSFPEAFEFKAEMDLAGAIGSSSNLRAQATDVYAQWSRYPFAQIRAGQFKTPYGFEQLHADTRTMTIERTLVSDRVTVGRGIGVQVAGDAGPVSYAVGAFNGNGTNLSFNDDEGFLTVARVSVTPWERGANDAWRIGANGYRGEDVAAPVAPELGFDGNELTGSRTAWGVDTQLALGRLEVWSELLRASFDPTSGAARDLEGWYAGAGWMLTKKWQGVVMVNRLDAPLDDTRTLTIGGNYLIKGHDLKLQFNVMRTNGDRTRVSARLQTLF